MMTPKELPTAPKELPTVLGYMVVIPNEHPVQVAVDWDGLIHPKELAEKELRAAHDRGYTGAFLGMLVRCP